MNLITFHLILRSKFFLSNSNSFIFYDLCIDYLITYAIVNISVLIIMWNSTICHVNLIKFIWNRRIFEFLKALIGRPYFALYAYSCLHTPFTRYIYIIIYSIIRQTFVFSIIRIQRLNSFVFIFRSRLREK